ncbi:MAG: FAD-binding protein, partial [Alistipes sp.]|nr:FAD-binding protein [Alistipes sp.]
FLMEQKSFAVGVRVEHPQKMIDDYAYGENIYELPPASYKVTYKAREDRGVYSFCMCPGGFVVNASSEEGRLCVNGMSYSKRDGENANSAVVVTVTPKDYEAFGGGPLAGIAFQRDLEEKAYKAGKGKIPCQTYKGFKEDRESTEFGEISPCTKGAFTTANLRRIFPETICRCIMEGMEGFAKQLPGFNREDAVLCGVESRTSSPVRMVRNEDLTGSFEGIYPCGEGAGYAGGITSAAVDGIRVAEAIAAERNTKGV